MFLTCNAVNKTYSAQGRYVQALSDVTVEVVEHEIVALIGPSGCGKSTLLRIIAGLDEEFEGEVSWSTPPDSGRDIGFVFQSPSLLPWRTVSKNVSLGLEGLQLSKAEVDAKVDELLALVGLEEFAKAFPAQLSGGMQQRVAIIRALAYNPRILLMDEPFGALDAITRDRLQDDLLNIWEKTHKTIVFVTHSVEEAAYLADKVVVMSPRPGRIKSIHAVPLPRDRRAEMRTLPEFAVFTGKLRSELE